MVLSRFISNLSILEAMQCVSPAKRDSRFLVVQISTLADRIYQPVLEIAMYDVKAISFLYVIAPTPVSE